MNLKLKAAVIITLIGVAFIYPVFGVIAILLINYLTYSI